VRIPTGESDQFVKQVRQPVHVVFHLGLGIKQGIKQQAGKGFSSFLDSEFKVWVLLLIDDVLCDFFQVFHVFQSVMKALVVPGSLPRVGTARARYNRPSIAAEYFNDRNWSYTL
jgi:hypothetical protein